MAAMSTILMAGAAGLGGMAVAKAIKPKAAPAPPPAADPAVEQAKADTEAAQAANAKIAQKTRARKASSLLAAGDPARAESGSSVLSSYGSGKTTLGA